MSATSTAIVIPAFNEGMTIRSIVSNVAEFGQPIVVDDGSTDNTSSVAEDAGASVLRHSVNKGYDAALRTGLQWSVDRAFQTVATIDADGQHDPMLLSRVLEPLVRGEAEMVLGIREKGARQAEKVFNRYAFIRFGIPDIVCGIKGYSVRLCSEHRRALDGNTIGTGLALAALRAGVRYQLVPVPIHPRVGGSRFGTGFKPDFRIYRALMGAIADDLTSPIRRAAPTYRRP